MPRRASLFLLPGLLLALGSAAAQAFVAVPADARVKGLDLYRAFVTYRVTITDISNAVAVKIR